MVNERPLISFTFDDFPRSAWREGGKILGQHDLRATYYVCLGLLAQKIETGEIAHASDLPVLMAAGHELGCHTYSHEHSWNTPPEKFVEAVRRNRVRLQELSPGSAFRSFSFPISYPRVRTKKRLAGHFSSCRCGGQTFNAGHLDTGLLAAFFLEKTRSHLSLVREVVEQNTRAGGWLIFATHDVGANPTRYGCSSQFFQDVVRVAVDSGAMILPVTEALGRAVKLQDAALASDTTGMLDNAASSEVTSARNRFECGGAPGSLAS